MQAPSTAVLVLGMHRSGTSALAGALGRCGVALGDALIEAAPDNPLGYFEHADAVLANERLLLGLERSWDDVRAMPAGWIGGHAARQAAVQIDREVVEPMSRHALWAVKDPRMSRLLPLWLQRLVHAGVDAACILMLRHPVEVAASLARRDGLPAQVASLLWLRHTLEAARACPERSCVLAYDELMAAPARALRRVGDALGLPLAIDPDAIAGAVDGTARHHRAGAARIESDLDAATLLAIDVYDALRAGPLRAAAEAACTRFDALVAEPASWIEALGAMAWAAESRRRRMYAEQVETERRAQHLQAGLDEASTLARARLDEMAQLDRRASQLQAALDDAERLVESGREQCAALDGALARAQALAGSHMATVHALQDGMATLAAVRARAEDLAVARLAQLQALDAELARLGQAKDAAEHIAASRLSDLAELRSHAEALATAKERAEKLASDHVADLQSLASDARALATAKDEAERLASAHLAELQSLASEARALAAAKDEAEQLAHRHAADLQHAQAALAAVTDALDASETLARGRLDELERADERFRVVERLALERLDTLHAAVAERDAARVELDARRVDLARLAERVEEESALRQACEQSLARIRAARGWLLFARMNRLPHVDE